jgi:nicotinate-nucleotide pyrophosphorylase (carboxylating)
VEVENERQLQTALELKPSVLLFDNQSPRVLKKLCRKVRKLKLRPAPQLEVSGGIALENVKAYAASGVDRISVGALTHSARSLNFSLEIQ